MWLTRAVFEMRSLIRALEEDSSLTKRRSGEKKKYSRLINMEELKVKCKQITTSLPLSPKFSVLLPKSMSLQCVINKLYEKQRKMCIHPILLHHIYLKNMKFAALFII